MTGNRKHKNKNKFAIVLTNRKKKLAIKKDFDEIFTTTGNCLLNEI